MPHMGTYSGWSISKLENEIDKAIFINTDYSLARAEVMNLVLNEKRANKLEGSKRVLTPEHKAKMLAGRKRRAPTMNEITSVNLNKELISVGKELGKGHPHYLHHIKGAESNILASNDRLSRLERDRITRVANKELKLAKRKGVF